MSGKPTNRLACLHPECKRRFKQVGWLHRHMAKVHPDMELEPVDATGQPTTGDVKTLNHVLSSQALRKARAQKAADTRRRNANSRNSPGFGMLLSDAITALEVKRDAMTETIHLLKLMNGDQI